MNRSICTSSRHGDNINNIINMDYIIAHDFCFPSTEYRSLRSSPVGLYFSRKLSCFWFRAPRLCLKNESVIESTSLQLTWIRKPHKHAIYIRTPIQQMRLSPMDFQTKWPTRWSLHNNEHFPHLHMAINVCLNQT